MTQEDLADQLSQKYQDMALELGSYMRQNNANIGTAEYSILADDLTRFITYSSTFNRIKDTIVFKNSTPYFDQIVVATNKINKEIGSINDANKAVNIAAALLSLAGFILTDDVPGIIASCGKLGIAITAPAGG